MNVPGMKYLKKAERTGNQAGVPMTDGLGVVDMFKLTAKEVSKDHLMAFAGNLAYKGLFALFPLFTLLLSLMGIFNATWVVDAFTNQLASGLPEGLSGFLTDQLQSIAGSQAETSTVSFWATLTAIGSILLALWGISGAMRSVMEAMNVMHDVEEARPFWKKYAISIFITLLVVALVLTALLLVVFGERIGVQVAAALGFGATFESAWNVAQWPLLAFLVLLAFAILYYFAPAAQQKFRWISPGSLIAFVCWLVFSLVFSYYVGNVGSFGAYGALAGVIILMLYFYYTAVIVLVGAEMNQVVEEYAPGGKNKGQKEPTDEEPDDERRVRK